jgi:hypothetical protein
MRFSPDSESLKLNTIVRFVSVKNSAYCRDIYIIKIAAEEGIGRGLRFVK